MKLMSGVSVLRTKLLLPALLLKAVLVLDTFLWEWEWIQSKRIGVSVVCLIMAGYRWPHALSKMQKEEWLWTGGEWIDRRIVLGALSGLAGFFAGDLVHYNWGDSEVVMVFY